MQPFYYLKSLVLNYRFESCCWIAPVRAGLIATGCFNALTAIVSILAIAEDSFPTTLIQVQTKINEDAVTKTMPLCAYITEIAFSAVCLAGIFRKDLVLLRVYMYYCVASLILSIMVYSIVILGIDTLIQIIILAGIVFQIYVILLVRSVIVEIKWKNKESQLPTLVMSTLLKEKDTNEQVSKNQEQEIKNEENNKEETVGDQTKDLETKTDPKTQEIHTGSETTEPKRDDVEKAPTDERKNGHKVEIKLETVNEEVVS